jgi:hypothetical protein
MGQERHEPELPNSALRPGNYVKLLCVFSQFLGPTSLRPRGTALFCRFGISAIARRLRRTPDPLQISHSPRALQRRRSYSRCRRRIRFRRVSCHLAPVAVHCAIQVFGCSELEIHYRAPGEIEPSCVNGEPVRQLRLILGHRGTSPPSRRGRPG